MISLACGRERAFLDPPEACRRWRCGDVGGLGKAASWVPCLSHAASGPAARRLRNGRWLTTSGASSSAYEDVDLLMVSSARPPR